MTTAVLFQEKNGKEGSVGIITLNRPLALNALNHEMVLAITKQLKLWEQSPAIKLVIITSENCRAFCAGGDLRYTYQCQKDHNPVIRKFFRDEYLLNSLIFNYSKPYVAIIDGITMGGGVGISIHGSHVIGTENTVVAMPETAIGFFPDVGGTYFLPRLPKNIGVYLGLVGERINIEECHALEIVDVNISAARIPEVMQLLIDTPFDESIIKTKVLISSLLLKFSKPKNAAVLQSLEMYGNCFAALRIENILEELKKNSFEFLIDKLLKKSPTSLVVTLLALQAGGTLSFNECLQQEFRLSQRFLEDHDFTEGIRALIIDKTNSPQWQPASLKNIDLDRLKKHYFDPMKVELFK